MMPGGGNAAGDVSLPSVSVKPATVVIVPNDKLVFQPALDQNGRSKAHIVVHNPTDDPIIYKFRTNHANQSTMAVRPCSGHIHPGEHADIDVSVDHSGDQEDLSDLKLLVVTAPAPSAIPSEYSLKTVWSNISPKLQNITKILCMLNRNPTENHCFASQVQTPRGPPDSSHLMRTFGQSRCGDMPRPNMFATMQREKLEDKETYQKRPVSYYVDVSSLADQEVKAGKGLLGNLMQLALMAVAGLAATKLLFE